MEHPNPFMSQEDLESQSATVSHQPELSFTESSYVPSVIDGKIDSDAKSARIGDDTNFADTSGLLGAAGEAPVSKPGIFTAKRWQSYFDVDTSDVLRRIYDSLFIPGDGDFMEKTARQPDFYGPFWICSTLIFVTAAAGSIVEALNHESDNWYYDVGEVTFCAVLFYGYTTLIPVVLYFALRYHENPLEFNSLLCLYGYSLFVFIPVSILSVVPIEWFRWMILIFGVLESSAFLVFNLQPRLTQLPDATMYTVLGSVVGVQVLLGLVLKLHFFQYW